MSRRIRRRLVDEPNDRPAYDVGRGKPPKHAQFSKGKSGNPKGRPKGSKNFKTTIERELRRSVAISEDGRRRRITKQEAVAKQLVNKAVSGDTRAMPLLFNETRGDPNEVDAPSANSALTDPADQLVLQSIVKRILEANVPAPPTQDEKAPSEEPPSPSSDKEGEQP
jgi:hypothetical protein